MNEDIERKPITDITREPVIMIRPKIVNNAHDPNGKEINFLFGAKQTAKAKENWVDCVKNGHVIEEKEGRKVAKTLIYIEKPANEAIEKLFDNYLTPFDRAVLAVCIGLQKEGQQTTTANTIFRSMGNKSNASSDMKQSILDSVNKMSSIRIRIEATEAYETLNRQKNYLCRRYARGRRWH